jgi:hypothetical protein
LVKTSKHRQQNQTQINEIINRMKKHAAEWAKVLANSSSNETLIPRIYQQQTKT